jgi:ABC-type multidrug transport system fused ATPase/permease subunit
MSAALEITKDYIREHKVTFYSFLVLSCVVYICKVIITANLYSKLSDEKADFKKTLIKICMMWVFITGLQSVKSYAQAKIVPSYLDYARKKLIENYVKNNEQHFDDTNVTNDLRLILDVSRSMRDVFLWVTTVFLPTVMVMICINIYFFSNYPKIGAVLVAGNVVSCNILSNSSKKLIEMSAIREKEYFNHVSKLEDIFSNLMNVYLNNKVESTIKENNKIETEYMNMFAKQEGDINKFIYTLKVNNYILALISIIMLYKTTNNHKDFVNGLFMFTFYLDTLEAMTYDFAFAIMTTSSIITNSEILGEKINKPIPAKTDQRKSLSNFSGNISFENIYFRYKKRDEKGKEELPWVFEDFSLKINSGDKIALIAQSGSGKTTLMKILLGFYTVDKGKILLDGVDIQEYSLKDVRQRINYINQRTLLFNDTIMANMKYGNKKTDEEIIEFLKKYDLLKIFCADGSNCLYKMVEKGGLNMSMGMQKVIYLVRGILKENVDVYIFDEPLTSIDPSTRDSVINMIKDETKNKTMIIITHDLEITKIVSRTVNLKDDEKEKK